MTNVEKKFIVLARPLNSDGISKKADSFIRYLGIVDDAACILVIGGLTEHGHDGRRHWLRRIGGRRNEITGLKAMVEQIESDGRRVVGLCKGLHDVNKGWHQPVANYLRDRGLGSRYTFVWNDIRFIMLGEVFSLEALMYLETQLAEYKDENIIVCVDLMIPEFLSIYFQKIKDYTVLGLIVAWDGDNINVDSEHRRENGQLHHVISLNSRSYAVCSVVSFGPNLITRFVELIH